MLYVYLAPAGFLFFGWWYVAMLTLQRGNAHKFKRNEIRNLTARKLTTPDLSNISFGFCAVKGMPAHFILVGNICRRSNPGMHKCLHQDLFVAVINTSHCGRDVISTYIGQHKLTIKWLLNRDILFASENMKYMNGVNKTLHIYGQSVTISLETIHVISVTNLVLLTSVSPLSRFSARYDRATFSQYCFIYFYLLCLMCLIGTVHALIVNWCE